MKVHIDITSPGQPAESLMLELPAETGPEQLAADLAQRLDLDPDTLADCLEELEPAGTAAAPGAIALAEGTRLRLHRVCIELHFTSEQATHRFPARARWSNVHRWGCRHFQVPPDARPQLELREGAPDGALLNERKPIGEFPGCKVVWLVKPGAEPNG